MARFAIALTCMGQDRHGFVPERRSLASSDVVSVETRRDVKESFVGYRWRSLWTHAYSRCNPSVTITALRAIPVRCVTTLTVERRGKNSRPWRTCDVAESSRPPHQRLHQTHLIHRDVCGEILVFGQAFLRVLAPKISGQFRSR